MSRQVKAFHWSLALHMLITFAVLNVGSVFKAPMSIDLTEFSLLSEEEVRTASTVPPSVRQQEKAVKPSSPVMEKNEPEKLPQPRPVHRKASEPREKPKVVYPKKAVLANKPVLKEKQEDVPDKTVAKHSDAELPETPTAAGPPSKTGSSPDAVTRKTEGSVAGPGLSAEQKRKQYLAQHFVYIRDLIMRHLSYPAIARKKGWVGQVKLSFQINIDGTVDAIAVVASSGFPILDRHAVDTVKKIAPFPCPPERADITIPITYALRN